MSRKKRIINTRDLTNTLGRIIEIREILNSTHSFLFKYRGVNEREFYETGENCRAAALALVEIENTLLVMRKSLKTIEETIDKLNQKIDELHKQPVKSLI